MLGGYLLGILNSSCSGFSTLQQLHVNDVHNNTHATRTSNTTLQVSSLTEIF